MRYQLTVSADNDHSLIGPSLQSAAGLMARLRTFRETNPAVPILVIDEEGHVLIDEGSTIHAE